MSSLIYNKHLLNEIFSNNEVVEVYVDENFNFLKKETELSVLVGSDDVTTKLFYAITNSFPGWSVKITTHPRNYIFNGKKLIWRKGTWLL